ncbi:MAG: hypothetical protein Q8O88_04780 [bacterium]|nr:hypothetical protein [bacterium]
MKFNIFHKILIVIIISFFYSEGYGQNNNLYSQAYQIDETNFDVRIGFGSFLNNTTSVDVYFYDQSDFVITSISLGIFKKEDIYFSEYLDEIIEIFENKISVTIQDDLLGSSPPSYIKVVFRDTQFEAINSITSVIQSY